MSVPELATESADRADRIYQALRTACDSDLRKLAELLASKADDQLLGSTEFTVRDIVHNIGAKAFQTALEERKKGGIKGPAGPARTVRVTPASSAIAARDWSASWVRSARSGPTTTASAAIRGIARPMPRWG